MRKRTNAKRDNKYIAYIPHGAALYNSVDLITLRAILIIALHFIMVLIEAGLQTRINLSVSTRQNLSSGFPTKRVSNQSLLLQRLASKLEFHL